MSQDLSRALYYIETHLKEAIDLHTLAEFAGYSEYHFSRVFKSIYNISAMKYVQRRKLIRASEEIIAGRSIMMTADTYGWDSQASFSRAFKNEYGFPPSLLKATSIGIQIGRGDRNMDHVFIKRMDEHATEEELLGILLQTIDHYKINLSEGEIRRASEKASALYKGLNRYSGDSYFTHCLNVAIILAEMEADPEVIIAGLCCDCIEKTSVSVCELTRMFNNKSVTTIVQADCLRQLYEKNEDIIAKELTIDDQNGLLVLLASRLHNMRTLQYLHEDKWNEKAQATIEVFLPLANIISNTKLIDELDHIAMQYIQKAAQ